MSRKVCEQKRYPSEKTGNKMITLHGLEVFSYNEDVGIESIANPRMIE